MDASTPEGISCNACPFIYCISDKGKRGSRHVIGGKKISDTFFGMHNLSQLGVWGRCKPPSGVQSNAYWQQATENCRINI